MQGGSVMSSRVQLLAARIRSRARLCLAVALAFMAFLAPRRAHASEDRWWYLDGFGEVGMTTVRGPLPLDNGGLLAVLDVGPGATWSARMLPWVHVGIGFRLAILPGETDWGRYYSLTVPIVLRFAVPLSNRGHELQLGGGIGIGEYWQLIHRVPSYIDEARVDATTTTAYEAFVGYLGPRTSTGLSLLLQGGTRYEDADILMHRLYHIVFVRGGISWR